MKFVVEIPGKPPLHFQNSSKSMKVKFFLDILAKDYVFKRERLHLRCGEKDLHDDDMLV